MTRISMYHSLGDPAEKLMHHGGLMLLWNTVKRLLDDVASERVHAQAQCAAFDCIGNGDNLLSRSMLEAALNEEIPKPIHHERIGLAGNRFDDLVFLFRCANLELLLQENGCLLVVTADNFVHNIFPITRNILVKKASVVERLEWRDIRLNENSSSLGLLVFTETEEIRGFYPPKKWSNCCHLCW